ncbi:MAG TPA: CsgG/HfaB family protein [Verrucomicrobiae bacterium]|nr:CsgG/HfaB family protein [Verrucomicrobiae bacterium]
MSKRKIIWIVGALLAGGLAAFWLLWSNNINHDPSIFAAPTDKDRAAFAAKYGQTNMAAPTPVVLKSLALSQPVRLAIGGLGLADDFENRQLADLVTVALAESQGLELVERQTLDRVLREQDLYLSGLVRAKDAVRIGKLLKADWFLLGTETQINEKKSLVIRVVDARTGIMRDAGVVSAGQSPDKVAADVAAFVRQSRQNAAVAKVQVYLAIGSFEDLSINNRLADFPKQLQGYLIAAYQGSNVILLEREYVDALLQEVRLDLAGLTDDNDESSAAPMQSAFWLVSGQYQSYETTNLQVEVNLDVQRIFGGVKHFAVRNLPVEPVGRQIKAAIDGTMNQKNENIIPSRWSEARMQLAVGKDLCQINSNPNMGDQALVWVGGQWDMEPQLAARTKRNLEQSMRAFKTVLLLEPTNNEAKMYLAACLRIPIIYRWEEARNYYREIIDESKPDKWTSLAQRAIGETFRWAGSDERLKWYESAAAQATNPVAKAFYRIQVGAAQNEVTIHSGDSPKAEELAENKLYDALRSFKSVVQGKGGTYSADMGMNDFVAAFNWDKATVAKKLAELLPKMEQQVPGLEPYLRATVLTYQVDTNTLLAAEFQQTLKQCVENPAQILSPQYFWNTIRWSVYDWCLEKNNYPLAIQLLEGERRAGAEGYVDYDDQEKIKLAYVYMSVSRWQDALTIFESFTNRPVKATADGAWGAAFKSILTDKLAAHCRQQLGAVVVADTRVFDMGKPFFCMHTPSTFIADDNGVWIGVGGRLYHLDFDLKTNLVIQLPVDDSVPITALCVTASNIWIGTRGAGLIDFDKASHRCRSLTEADGLLMNDLGSLTLTGDSLWIGYGGATGGGLGRLDLRSQKFISFMPSLHADATAQTGETPAREPISKITAINNDELLLLVHGGLREFHMTRGVWGTFPNKAGDWVSAFSADSAWFVEAGGNHLTEIIVSDKPNRNGPTNEVKKTNMVVTSAELSQLNASLRTNGSGQYVSSISSGRLGPRGSLAIQNLRDHRWQNLVDADGLPNPPSTLTLDGNNVWAGGEGAIALVDLNEAKVKKFCHIKAAGVERIQIAGGYVWAQFDSHLYRAPLNEIQ